MEAVVVAALFVLSFIAGYGTGALMAGEEEE